MGDMSDSLRRIRAVYQDLGPTMAKLSDRILDAEAQAGSAVAVASPTFERVNFCPATTSGPGQDVVRRRVPGGWLYTTTAWMSGGSVSVHSVFVPDEVSP